MDKQLSLSALSDELSQVRTKKREFLDEIEHIVPWGKMDKHCSSAGAIPADGAVALWSCVTRRILNDASFQTNNENALKEKDGNFYKLDV